MSSTNKTDFLKLNVWSGDDYLERVDMNKDNAAVDEFASTTNREILNLKSEKANVADMNKKIYELEGQIGKLGSTAADKEELEELSEELETLRVRVVNLTNTVDTKANKSYVDEQLKTKASVSAMNNKADSSRVGVLEDDMKQVKQSGLNGKNQLETSIKSKGGKVNKAGEVATFNELDLGIKSIITDPSIGTTARSGDILTGKTAVSNGLQVTGTIPVHKTINTIADRHNQKIKIPMGYYPTDGEIGVSITNLKPENVKKGVTVGGIKGTAGLEVSNNYDSPPSDSKKITEGYSWISTSDTTSITRYITIHVPGEYYTSATYNHSTIGEYRNEINLYLNNTRIAQKVWTTDYDGDYRETASAKFKVTSVPATVRVSCYSNAPNYNGAYLDGFSVSGYVRDLNKVITK